MNIEKLISFLRGKQEESHIKKEYNKREVYGTVASIAEETGFVSAAEDEAIRLLKQAIAEVNEAEQSKWNQKYREHRINRGEQRKEAATVILAAIEVMKTI